MGSLSNLYISQSYQSLIHLATDNTASATLIPLQDGLGNSIGVAVNTRGDLFLSGSLTASLQEGYLYVGDGNGKTRAFSTSSLVVSINTGSLVTTSSFNSYTQSVNTQLSNLNLYTASNDTKWNNLSSQSGSWITESETASFAYINRDNNWSANQTFTNITAVSASFTYVQTTYETASVIYSSGSNQFGDELSDIQTLSGSVKVQGSLTVNGTAVLTSSVDLTPLNNFTSSQNTKNSTLESVTASLFTSTSLALYTASFNTSSRNLTFTKGNNSTFSVNIPDISGSTINTSSFATTGSNTFTGQNVFNDYVIIGNAASKGIIFTTQNDGNGDYGHFNMYNGPLNNYGQSPQWEAAASGNGQLVISALSPTYGYGINLNGNVFVNGNQNITGSLTASLQEGYVLVGDGSGVTKAVATSSFAASGVSIADLNAFTASQEIKDSSLANVTGSLNVATASLFTSTSLSLTTASVSGQLLTFTKGNASQFTLILPTGSQTIVTGSYGAFQDSTTQSGSANTAYKFKFNTTDISDGVILSGSTGMQVGAYGTYNLEWSGQAVQGAGSAIVSVWVNVNGIQISGSRGDVTLASNSKLLPAWNYFLTLNPLDVVELEWASDSGNTTWTALPIGTTPTTPAAASIIATLARVDVGGGTNSVSTSSFNAFTSSMNAFTASENTKSTTLANVTASLNSYTASNDTKWTTLANVTASLNSYTASNDTKWNNLQTTTASFSASVAVLSSLTGSYATTGSNNFVGTETISDAGGNSLTIAPYSGSYVFVQKGFASGSANLSHITASNGVSSTPFGGNLIIKRDNNQNSIIISGSSNIITNPGAGTSGFVRMLGNENLILSNTGVPQISGSMIASGVNTFNIFRNTTAGGAAIVRGASTGSFVMSGNLYGGTITLGTTATTDMKQAGVGISLSQNVIQGSLTGIAWKTPLSASVQASTNFIGGAATLTMDSSSIQMSGMTVQGVLSVNSSYYPSTLNTSAATSIQVGLSIGNANLIYTSGSNTTFTNGRVFSGIGIVGNNNTFNANQNGDLSHVVGVIALGSGLGITGSSATYSSSPLASHGSVFVGRFNAQDGNKSKTAETVFAVGTGTSTSALKTGFLIDSGSNAFVEGTLNVSGSTSFTGSAPSILSGSFSGSIITNLTDTFTSVAAVQQIVSLSSGSYAGLVSGSLTNSNTLYIIV